jgi:hypothetical protein
MRMISIAALTWACGGPPNGNGAPDAGNPVDTGGANPDGLGTLPSCVGLSDTAMHPPPTSGPYGYGPPGDFTPDKPGFPKVGESFVDPVFGCSVRRLTDVGLSSWGSSLIYSKNGFWNADGTRYANSPDAQGQIDIIDGDTGAIVRAKVPFGGSEGSFDPVDPDVFYAFAYQSPELRKFQVSTGVSTVIKTLPAALQSLGGSVDWIDRTGRYFLLNYSGTLHVWAQQTDTMYTGTVPATFGNGWAGL